MRFAHLLQPIRDLTKNWEVDVATQLGEYLEEVRAAGEWHGPGDPGCSVTLRLRVCSRLVFCPQSCFFTPSTPVCLSKLSSVMIILELSFLCLYRLASCVIGLVG